MTLRLKLIALGLLGIAVVSGYFAWQHYERQVGAAKVEARDAKLALAAEREAREQERQDAKATEDAVNGLQAERDRLRDDLAARPVPSLRLCVSAPGSGSGVRATPGAAGGASPGAPTGRDGAEVPTGAVAGPDVGGELQLVALVADELAAQVRALLEREHALNE